MMRQEPHSKARSMLKGKYILHGSILISVTKDKLEGRHERKCN